MSEHSESVNGTNAGRKSLPKDKGPDVPADSSSSKDKAPEPSLEINLDDFAYPGRLSSKSDDFQKNPTLRKIIQNNVLFIVCIKTPPLIHVLAIQLLLISSELSLNTTNAYLNQKCLVSQGNTSREVSTRNF
ncbi:hypothetical protein YC2023_061126 [Brassica napus]